MNKEKERTFKILSCPFLISPSKLWGCQDLSFSLSVLNLEKDVSNLPLRSWSLKQNMSPNEHLKICLKLIFHIKRDILIVFYFIAYVNCVGLHVKMYSSYSSVLLWLPGSRKITCIGWRLPIYSMSYYTSIFPSNLTLNIPLKSKDTENLRRKKPWENMANFLSCLFLLTTTIRKKHTIEYTPNKLGKKYIIKKPQFAHCVAL